MIRDWNESFSLIRFLHAIPEGEEVDVYINDTPFYEDLDFADFSPYVYVPKGNYTVNVYLADTRENPILSQNINVGVNQLVTMAISGENNDIKLVPVVEEVVVVSGNNSNIRVVHLSPNAPSINILADNQLLFEDIDYREVTDYITVPSKTYTIRIEDSATNRLIVQNQITINPSQIYTFYAVGNLSNLNIIQSLDGSTFIN